MKVGPNQRFVPSLTIVLGGNCGTLCEFITSYLQTFGSGAGTTFRLFSLPE